jgi:alanine racemase
MAITRRNFVAGAAASPLLTSLSSAAQAQTANIDVNRFDPWLEVSADALRANVETVSQLAGERPVLAVIKNNAYGLGLTTVAPILEEMPQVRGFAVVKADEALALRAAGISKPILLLALFSESDGVELVRQGIQFSLCTDDVPGRVVAASRKAGQRARAQIYLDTGMSRMGIPWHRAEPVLQDIASLDIDIEGTFMGFAEEPEFDSEQLRRFTEVTGKARASGIDLGPVHAASSHAVFNFPDSHLEQVRPGIALFGAYPSGSADERNTARLQPAASLKARVVRVEQLRPGDSVSYGRNYVADKPVWIATIPAGHTDGMPRKAVDGSKVLINGDTYPVIGAVSASHTIVEVGEERRVDIGDVATLLGPGHEVIHPNNIAAATATSVYDRLMHLNPLLPKIVV